MDFCKGFKKLFFFRRMGAPRDDDWIIIVKTEFFLVGLEVFGHHFCIGLIKFRIARYIDAALFRAQMLNVFGINGTLHAETGHASHHIIKDAVKVPVTFDGFIGNTAVYHHDGNAAALDGTQKIRPQLRFHRHEDTRHDALDKGFGYKRHIKREIDDGVRFGNDLVGHVIAPRRHGRNQDLGIRHSLADFLHKGACGHNFTYAGPVDPDTILVCNGCDFIVTNKAAGKSFFPEIAPDEIRQYKKDQQHHCQEVIQIIHESPSFHFIGKPISRTF